MRLLSRRPKVNEGAYSKVPTSKQDVEALDVPLKKRHVAMGGLVLRQEYDLDHDDKTGLLTSGGFKKKAAEFRTNNPTAKLLYVRIDVGNFKGVNDEHGHPFGDRVLSLIGASFYNSDLGSLFAREGGDELVAIINLDEVHNEEGRQMTYDQRSKAVVDKIHGIGDSLRTADNRLGLIGFNFGVGVYQMRPTDTLEAADQIADISLYDDKILQKEIYGSYHNGGLSGIKPIG